MKKYVYIFIGGFIGAILRYLLKEVTLGTLITNVLGCFLIGLILTLAFEILDFNSNIRLGIATGLLGAFTTFSTVCKESFKLIVSGNYLSCILYIFVTVAFGLFAVYLGTVLAKKIVSNRVM